LQQAQVAPLIDCREMGQPPFINSPSGAACKTCERPTSSPDSLGSCSPAATRSLARRPRLHGLDRFLGRRRFRPGASPRRPMARRTCQAGCPLRTQPRRAESGRPLPFQLRIAVKRNGRRAKWSERPMTRARAKPKGGEDAFGQEDDIQGAPSAVRMSPISPLLGRAGSQRTPFGGSEEKMAPLSRDFQDLEIVRLPGNQTMRLRFKLRLVEPDGIEPTTSSMPLKRSPN
jgi:hypothetical protein